MKAKKLLWGIAPLMALAPIVAAKCGDGNETKSIVFQIGHRKSWPLSGGLALLQSITTKHLKAKKILCLLRCLMLMIIIQHQNLF